MGTTANAPPKPPTQPDKRADKMSGQPNGTLHPHATRRSRRKAQQTYLRWAVDKGAKALVWYTLGTVLLRCPARHADLTPSTPQICTPYLHARDYLAPYAQPYYDQYLSPYVQQAQPYYDQFNAKLYQPGYAAYEKYGAPQVALAQKFGEQQWQKTIKPQLDFAQKEAGKQYAKTLAPHVKTAQDSVQPLYDRVVTSASDIWELELEPVYRKSAPVAQKIYLQGQAFAVHTALPHAQYVGNTAWTFWTRQIWPKIRILYGENVEPQLLRITERLGRYKDGKKLEADIKSMESESKIASAQSSADSVASSVASTYSEVTASPSSAASAAASKDPEPSIDPAVQFQEDLKSWEHICAKAVDEGAEDLKERIKDITAHQISSADSLGNALVTQLEQTTQAALNSVKARIQQIVKELPEDADVEQIETAKEDLVQGLRAAGQNIKQRAQAVREWRRTSQTETESLVDKALQSTLETIDSIRELRLTEIGRKYASCSLPHKEWSRYNDIKKATQTWRNDVEKAARDHSGLTEAKAAADDVEQTAMAIAEDAAKELGRLKEVGKWKIDADDASEDFTTKNIPPPVRKFQEQIVQKAAEASQAASGAIYGSEQDAVESATSVAEEKVSEMASKASEAVVGSSTGSVESISSQASKSASSLSEKIVGASTGSVESAASKVAKSAQSVASQASDFAEKASSSASTAVVGESSLSDTIKAAASSASSVVVGESSFTDGLKDTFTSVSDAVKKPVVESPSGAKLSSMLAAQKSKKALFSSANQAVKDAASKASHSASSVASSLTSTPFVSEASSSASSIASAASSVASSVYNDPPDAEDIANAAGEAAHKAGEAPQKVFAGAHAQILVEAREPILDDDDDDDDTVDREASFSASVQQIIDAAGDQGSQLTQAIQDAISRATATSTQGSVESVTSLAHEQYESALSAASSALFGTQNFADKGSKAIEKQYQSAVTAASYAIYGTPITAAPLAAASSAYNEAVSEASKNYESVKSRISEQMSGTSKPVHEEMLASAQSAYSGAVAAASDRLGSAFGTTTQNYLDQISSIASSRLAEGVSVAQEQYKNAKIAVGAEPTPVHQQYLASAQSAYYQALGMAHGRYSEFIEAASGVVAPAATATGYQASVESVLSQARSAYSAYTSDAYSKYSVLHSMATAAASDRGAQGGSKEVDKSVLENLEEQIVDAVSIARSKLSVASISVSSAYSSIASEETQKPLTDQAAENWNALIAKASEQVYGAPAPFTEQVYSRATELTAQATEAAGQAAVVAAAQYEQVQALVSELVYGQEADFTASVYSRLQSAYSTGLPAAASQAASYASGTYESAASFVSAVFVPPTEVPGILEQVQSQLNDAVEAASAQVYGSPKGALQESIPQATEAASSVATDAASVASEAIYGSETNYLEAAQANLFDIGASASSAVSAALYGSPKPTTEVAASAAASLYSSLSSQASEQAAAASKAVSSALYGEEQTYLEGVQSQIQAALASAASRLEGFGADASKAAEEAVKTASSVVASATDRVRDEL